MCVSLRWLTTRLLFPRTLSGKIVLYRNKSISRFTWRTDGAIPGKHTRQLYKGLTRAEAPCLSQLRTGHSRLHMYLCKVNARDSPLCEEWEAVKSVQHFLFTFQRWRGPRNTLREAHRPRFGDLSYALGGYAGPEKDGDVLKRKPDMDAVRASIKFAMETRRLEFSSIT